MNCAKLLDIYTDYLIVQNSQATATGCSELLDNWGYVWLYAMQF